jgi:hypothetical protein
LIHKDTSITIYERPSSDFTARPDQVIVPDQPVYCKPLYPKEGETYLWNFGDSTTSTEKEPVHYYKSENNFIISLIVTSGNNCRDTSSNGSGAGEGIKALGGGLLKTPNGFTPNMGGTTGGEVIEGDYSNHVFAPLSTGVVEYHLEIFNRWGERLFKSDVKNLGWDGYYMGKLCKEDVYVWKASGKFSNGKSFTKAGTITLLHTTY